VWIDKVGNGRTTDSIGVEGAAHFEILPTLEREYGWFLEPSYAYSFGSGHCNLSASAQFAHSH